MSEGKRLVQTIEQKLSEKVEMPASRPVAQAAIPEFVAMQNKVIVKELKIADDKATESGLVIRADRSGTRTKKCEVLSSGHDSLKAGDVVIIPTHALYDIDYGDPTGEVVYGCSILDIFTRLK